jgi:hypothetical protein
MQDFKQTDRFSPLDDMLLHPPQCYGCSSRSPMQVSFSISLACRARMKELGVCKRKLWARWNGPMMDGYFIRHSRFIHASGHTAEATL